MKMITPVLLLLAAGVPAAASAQDVTPVVAVSYSDLDLASAAGIATLDRRIASAIEAVCPDDWSIELARKMAVSRCRKDKRAEVAATRAVVLADAARTGQAIAAR